MNVGSLTVEATEGIKAIFPDVRPVDGKLTLEHTPRTTIPLRAMGYDVPSSMRTTYDWNGGTPFNVRSAPARA